SGGSWRIHGADGLARYRRTQANGTGSSAGIESSLSSEPATGNESSADREELQAGFLDWRRLHAHALRFNEPEWLYGRTLVQSAMAQSIEARFRNSRSSVSGQRTTGGTFCKRGFNLSGNTGSPDPRGDCCAVGGNLSRYSAATGTGNTSSCVCSVSNGPN